MNKRLELHNKLVALLNSNNVYFQPPSTIKIQYPCIIYRRSSLDLKRANDLLYNKKTGYTITLIDSNPDNNINDKLILLPFCSFDRHYTADNLNHDVYTIYY